MDIPAAGWTAIGGIGGAMVTALSGYLFKRLVFKRVMTKEERENIAAGYASLIDSQQEQIDRLALVVSDNHASYMRDLRAQREECALELKHLKASSSREISQIRDSCDKENAVLTNKILRLREEYEAGIAKRDKDYAEVLLELRSLQLKVNLHRTGEPGSPPP